MNNINKPKSSPENSLIDISIETNVRDSLDKINNKRYPYTYILLKAIEYLEKTENYDPNKYLSQLSQCLGKQTEKQPKNAKLKTKFNHYKYLILDRHAKIQSTISDTKKPNFIKETFKHDPLNKYNYQPSLLSLNINFDIPADFLGIYGLVYTNKDHINLIFDNHIFGAELRELRYRKPKYKDVFTITRQPVEIYFDQILKKEIAETTLWHEQQHALNNLFFPLEKFIVIHSRSLKNWHQSPTKDKPKIFDNFITHLIPAWRKYNIREEILANLSIYDQKTTLESRLHEIQDYIELEKQSNFVLHSEYEQNFLKHLTKEIIKYHKISIDEDIIKQTIKNNFNTSININEISPKIEIINKINQIYQTNKKQPDIPLVTSLLINRRLEDWDKITIPTI